MTVIQTSATNVSFFFYVLAKVMTWKFSNYPTLKSKKAPQQLPCFTQIKAITHKRSSPIPLKICHHAVTVQSFRLLTRAFRWSSAIASYQTPIRKQERTANRKKQNVLPVGRADSLGHHNLSRHMHSYTHTDTHTHMHGGAGMFFHVLKSGRSRQSGKTRQSKITLRQCVPVLWCHVLSSEKRSHGQLT